MDDAELAARIRDPLIGIEDVRIHAARQTSTALFLVGGAEAIGGLAVAFSNDELPDQGAGGLLLAGGFASITTGVLQRSLSGRRHAAFVAELADVEGRPDAWPAMARDLRLDVERDARGHAFATGVYASMLGASVLTVALSGEKEPPLALIVVGGVGFTHHVVRWRTAQRLSVDLDTLPLAVPGPVVQ